MKTCEKQLDSLPVAVAIDTNVPVEGLAVEAVPIPITVGGISPNSADQSEIPISLLAENHWPLGLQATLVQTVQKYPLRYFICDDSGSMLTNDGNKIVGEGINSTMLRCTRWSELSAALKFHVRLADQLQAVSQFRFLNSSCPITIGDGAADSAEKIQKLLQLLEASPSGGTPLCRHIREVIDEIKSKEIELRRNGQRACLVIATDGESTDGNLTEAMRPLQNLPVWVVVRLCTDQENIVTYWNQIDSDLELDMDVIDDLCGEAEEVRVFNRWLNYAEPLHRLREFGIPIKEFDLLDESLLSLEQLRVFSCLVFGGALETYPHPQVDWSTFVSFIQTKNEEIGRVWSPTQKRLEYWIDLSNLNSANEYQKLSEMTKNTTNSIVWPKLSEYNSPWMIGFIVLMLAYACMFLTS